MQLRIKGLTSLSMACLFLIVSFSGIILYMTPQGRVANWTNWTLLGLGKHDWSAVHINACFVMLVVVTLHWIWNWKVFWSYIKRRTGEFNLKREMVAALLLSIGVVAGTILQLPPFRTVMTWNDQIKDYWASQVPQAPAPHAEQFDLRRFSQAVGVPVDDLLRALEEEGFEITDGQTTIAELAAQKDMAPSDVHRIIQTRFPESRQATGSGGGRGRGQVAEQHPDPFQGQGRGMGRGMGQGRGAGQGRGMGMGQGRGMEMVPDAGPDTTGDVNPSAGVDD